MFRYFDLIGQNVCSRVHILNGSPAATADAKEFNEFFKTEVREVNRQKYQALLKKYG